VPLFRRHPHNWEAMTDEELVGRAQRGQREAFGVLYDRYLNAVYGYCHRMLGDRLAAEDANSTVFTKALSALPSYQARSFRSWLFAIAHNVIVDELRGQRVTLPLEAAGALFDPDPSPEELAITAIERQSLESLLPCLSADQQYVVALRISGLTAAEIAEAMGRPRNAIDGIQHRAINRLRELMTAGSYISMTKGGGDV
jgi:RNA polymerase sigma-70 factor (ECF subfamily)